MLRKSIQRGFSIHPSRKNTLANIEFVMVGTTHAGNIGSVARIMRNTALCNLSIVSSLDVDPDTDAYAMSSGAYSIIQRALRFDSLEEALSLSTMAVGTSGRLSSKRVYAKTPDELVPEMVDHAEKGKVSIVFGRESRGLTNDELKLCTHHLIIPTDADFASMNVAVAAGIVAYELFRYCCRPVGFQTKKFKAAPIQSKEQMFSHIEEVLVNTGFAQPSNALRMMREIRRILNSAQMDNRDVAIFRGIFRKIANTLRILNTK
jgi:tRNA (cytidine32/uridine32-2'-O)-methyltransferase